MYGCHSQCTSDVYVNVFGDVEQGKELRSVCNMNPGPLLGEVMNHQVGTPHTALPTCYPFTYLSVCM